MDNLLKKIESQTKQDLAKRKREISLRDLESLPAYEKGRKDFYSCLKNELTVTIIAEIKRASPSQGVIRKEFNPIKIADQYLKGGAAAISVLTDKPFFQGSLEILSQVASVTPLPILRKDFIVDPYQVKEARAWGADALLLIVSMYEGNQLTELLDAAEEYGMSTLVECYHDHELTELDWERVNIAGVNNRNLTTFEVDLHRGIRSLKKVPDHVVSVSESGIHSQDDLRVLWENGIQSALIGEHFMKQHDPGEALRDLIEAFESERQGRDLQES